MAWLPMRSMMALRRAVKSATRSRCQEAGGGGATFQTPVSAAKHRLAAVSAKATSFIERLAILTPECESRPPIVTTCRRISPILVFMRSIQLAASLVCFAPLLAVAQPAEKVDLNAIHRIKKEALGRNSKVMDHMFWLTDANGPRLTDSKGYRAAGEWAVKRLKDYGLANVHLEKWGKRRAWKRAHGSGWERWI